MTTNESANAATEEPNAEVSSGGSLPDAFSPSDYEDAYTSQGDRVRDMDDDDDDQRNTEVDPDDEGNDADDDDGGADADGSAGDDSADGDDELVGRAKEFGYTDDEIKSLVAGKQLAAVVRALDKGLSKLGRDGGDATGSAGESKSAGDGKKAAEGKDSATGSDDELVLELDPEVFDGRLIKTLNQVNSFYAGRMKALKAELASVTDGLSQSRFDERVAGLGKDYENLFGKGSTDSLSKGTSAAKNRSAVRDEMKAIAAGYKTIGRPVPGEGELFSRAVRSLFGDKIENTVKKNIATQLRERSKKFIARPTPRKAAGESVDPYQKAVKFAQEKLNEFGAGEV